MVMGQWLIPPPARCGNTEVPTQAEAAQRGEDEISVGGEGPRAPPPSASAPPIPTATVLWGSWASAREVGRSSTVLTSSPEGSDHGGVVSGSSQAWH